MTTDATVQARADQLFTAQMRAIHARTDRMFAGLIVAQWFAAIGIALFYSPYAWEGLSRSLHPHVVAAIALGGAISSFPVALAFLRPGAFETRVVIAATQMLWSALLIHLTGGRIETHFHVFGSLAFLAFYRDWRVLVPATIVVAGDHMIRQFLWPESVYGIANPEWWRFLEHAFWVVFEDVFLVVACLRGVEELRAIAQKRAELDEALADALRAKDAAESANRTKSQFLANMSHELRTPINGVIGMTELVNKTELSAKQRQYIDTIHSSGAALLGVVNDILDFSKAEAGKLQLEELDMNVGAVVDDVVAMLGPEAAKKGLALTCTVSPALAQVVRGDPTRLRRVLGNLVANAIKFTERGGVVVRAIDSGAGVARFEVQDDGIGISAADQARLFQAFNQVDASHSRRYGGTGLGLAIAKQIVHALGGELGVTSEVGKGSTFWFTTPLKPSASAAAPSPAHVPAAVAAVIGAAPVLVAEDNAVNQQVMVEMLAHLGYAADLVDTGRAAVEALGKKQYAAVLMDCQMPEMSGYEAVAEIRKNEGVGAHVPILAVTAHALAGDRERAIAAGMDEYVSKPLSLAKLSTLLQQFLPRPASAAALDPSVRRSRKVIELALADVSSARERLLAMASDVAAVKQAAHRFKGTCLMLGATKLARCCMDIEAAPENAAAILAGCAGDFAAARDALTAELAVVLPPTASAAAAQEAAR